MVTSESLVHCLQLHQQFPPGPALGALSGFTPASQTRLLDRGTLGTPAQSIPLIHTLARSELVDGTSYEAGHSTVAGWGGGGVSSTGTTGSTSASCWALVVVVVAGVVVVADVVVVVVGGGGGGVVVVVVIVVPGPVNKEDRLFAQARAIASKFLRHSAGFLPTAAKASSVVARQAMIDERRIVAGGPFVTTVDVVCRRADSPEAVQRVENHVYIFSRATLPKHCEDGVGRYLSIG